MQTEFGLLENGYFEESCDGRIILRCILEVGCEDERLMRLAQDCVQYRALVFAALNFSGSIIRVLVSY